MRCLLSIELTLVARTNGRGRRSRSAEEAKDVGASVLERRNARAHAVQLVGKLALNEAELFVLVDGARHALEQLRVHVQRNPDKLARIAAALGRELAVTNPRP